MTRTLYICYFGLREPLVQTQVLPYLREIRKAGIEISLLTFEPKDGRNSNKERADRSTEFEKIRNELELEGIEWNWLTYHKRFSVAATAYDILAGTFFVWNKLRREHIDVLHGRVHVPTLMGAIARKFSSQKPKLLFDIRGFFPEEYTDAGRWRDNGWLYRLAKRVERWLYSVSDGFVVLTETARNVLFPESFRTGFDKAGRPVEVIPCCIDESRFGQISQSSQQKIRSDLELTNRFVIVHTGSIGGLYLTNEIAVLLGKWRRLRRDTFALFLTQSDPKIIAHLLEREGFGKGDFLITKVHPGKVPNYLAVSHVGISLVKAGYATISRSPTKLPEYLAVGLPVVSNAGVGDVDEQLISDGTGTILNELNIASYEVAFDEVLRLLQNPELGDICRRSASRRFSLKSIGGPRYRRIYSRLIGDIK